MKSILRRRPSPALIIAIIALFVSLGGVSYGFATGSIDNREIKNNDVRTRDLRNNDVRTRDLRNNDIRTLDLRNNEVRGLDIRNSTVQGRDVALNTLTGDDVNESRLGKVPSATIADSATQAATAANAQTLNGLRIVPIKHRSGNVANQAILDAGGLQLVVSCAGGNEEVHARTTVAGSEIAVISDDAASPDPLANLNQSFASHNLDDDFNPGDDFDLQDTADASDDRIFQLHFLAGNGADVTVHLITDDDLGASNCIVSGYAVVN